MRERISMILLNAFTHDARVDREAKSLVESGYEVTVYALFRSGLPKHEFRNGYEIFRLDVSSIGFSDGNIAPILKYLVFMRQLWNISKVRPADFYHSHDAISLIATYPLVKRDRAKWIYDAHELEIGRKIHTSRRNRLYHWLGPIPERLFIRRVNAVICVNDSIASILVNNYGIQTPTVLRNIPSYATVSKTDIIRKALNLSTSNLIILYQGAVIGARGLDIAMGALPLLDNAFHFVVLGEGSAKLGLIQLADELGISNRVHFLGYVPSTDLLNYTASADVGISLIQNNCLNNYYSLPNKLFEYIMAGVPVVASGFPEMRKVIEDYQIGETVMDPTSHQEAATAIEKIFSSPVKYQELLNNARIAGNVLNWENEQGNLLDLYSNI